MHVDASSIMKVFARVRNSFLAAYETSAVFPSHYLLYLFYRGHFTRCPCSRENCLCRCLSFTLFLYQLYARSAKVDTRLLAVSPWVFSFVFVCFTLIEAQFCHRSLRFVPQRMLLKEDELSRVSSKTRINNHSNSWQVAPSERFSVYLEGNVSH